jgi:predicted acetyltransferase
VQTAGAAVHTQWQDEWMASWFANPRVYALIILNDRRPAGFALVGRSPQPGIDQRMVEFFITPMQRRTGVGRAAARLIFDRFGGTWEITTSVCNQLALSFWRALLAQYTGGRYRERFLYGEVSQVFAWQRQR